MTDIGATKLQEAQERMNARALVALPAGSPSYSCGHCGAECTVEDYAECKPCGLYFDRDDDAFRLADDEPECGAVADLTTLKFWIAAGSTLHPCNLTKGHTTEEHHHPQTWQDVTP